MEHFFFFFFFYFFLIISSLSASDENQHHTLLTLKGVDIEKPNLDVSPSLLLVNSDTKGVKKVLRCERVQVSGISRLKLGSYANSYHITLAPSVAIPERLHSKIKVCFHRNNTLGWCQCEKDEWKGVQKGVWGAVMSPYETRYVDVKIDGEISGSVTVALEEGFQQWRLISLAVGLLLLLVAPIVSSWVPFYYSSSMAIGIFLVIIIVLFQGMKLLPTGRKNIFYLTIYGSVLGAGSFLLHQFSMIVNSILQSFGMSEEMHNPVALFVLLGIILAGAALGYWIVRRFVISKEDGSVDAGVAQFVKWAMRVVGTTFVLQSTLDTPLAVGVLVSCGAVCKIWSSIELLHGWYETSGSDDYSLEWVRGTRGRAEFLSKSPPKGKMWNSPKVGSKGKLWNTPKGMSWSDSPVRAMSTQVEANPTQEVNQHEPIDSTQAEAHPTEANEDEDPVLGRKRKKTSKIWEDFDLVKIKGVMKGVPKRKLHMSTEKRQTTIPFQPSNAVNPFIVPGARYCNEKMREIMATAMMVHENPFNAAEHQIWVWAFEYANSEFRKVSHKTARNDCVALYEKEKKILKTQLESVSKISLTTDMWRSSHQVVEYMVITGHFIDVGWNLNKRVLSFVKVPAPRRGIDVADAIYKCLKTWGIENKVFSVSVDNASYNDSCLRCLKDNLSLTGKLILGGSLFHVRCCAHILNLLVQDGLSKIKDTIFNIRESVKYINHNDGRLKAFCDVVEQKGLKERKLIIDCPTRWNSTFNMLSTALKFKIAFASYQEREPHYDLAPSLEEWNKVEKVCKLLEVFNYATHVISGSEYPTANLYLAEVWKVKVILDEADEDADRFMREMASPMKAKFDKYWGECNLLMAIASVLDPRCKFHMVRICFPKIYKSQEVADENIKKVRSSLDELYDDYVALSLADASSSNGNLNSNTQSSSQANVAAVKTGFDEIMCLIQENVAISPMKSELQQYLDEGIYVPNTTSFSALDWWRNNSMKYKILSKMAADILAIPISTVASESTFSAGGRVIDEFRSRLSEESVEALICGGDWFRHKYNVTKNSKVGKEEIQVNLKI